MSCKWWYNREKNDFTQRKKKESEERILSSLKTLIIFQLDTSEQNHYTSLYTITQK